MKTVGFILFSLLLVIAVECAENSTVTVHTNGTSHDHLVEGQRDAKNFGKDKGKEGGGGGPYGGGPYGGGPYGGGPYGGGGGYPPYPPYPYPPYPYPYPPYGGGYGYPYYG